MLAKAPIYKRILLKLSGESLQNDHLLGMDIDKLSFITQEINTVVQQGVQVALVIGGGNLVRGADLQANGFNRVTADHMGMLATIINGLALRDALEKASVPVSILSACAVPGIIEQYEHHAAKDKLQQGHVVILVAGTGTPLVTTDSAAALRGIEIEAEIVLKATKVDGIFAADPLHLPMTDCYQQLSYAQVIEKRLGIMDLTAILLCQAHQLPIRVFNMHQLNVMRDIILGKEIGTLITQEPLSCNK